MRLNDPDWPLCSFAVIKEAHLLNVLRRSETLQDACDTLAIDPSVVFRWRSVVPAFGYGPKQPDFKFLARQILSELDDILANAGYSKSRFAKGFGLSA